MVLSSEILRFIRDKLYITSDDGVVDSITLADGRSGAEVYRIKVKSQRNRFSGNYIVKVCDVDDRANGNEADKATALHQYAPKFTDHLVRVVGEKVLSDKRVIIYSQANNRVIDSTSLNGLDADHMAQHIKQVAYDLLNLMNEDYKTEGTVADFFNCLLSKQLSEEGRFAARVEAILDRPDAECVALNGTIFPNPLHFMNTITLWSDKLSSLLLMKGASHGDLHGDNIIAANDTYSVIDFDSTSVDSFLLYDHAYLEFSIFYDNFKDNDLMRWKEQLVHLITPSLFKTVEPCGAYLEYRVRNAVCQGICDWVNNNELMSLRDDIEVQFLMARIASGINFFCKKTCADLGKQIKVLFYIAHCFELLLLKAKYEYDKNDISTLKCATFFDDTESMWEGFVKHTHCIPILITDDKYTKKDTVELKNICRIDWRMVIDIGEEADDIYVYSSLIENIKTRTVKKINVITGEEPETFENTLNVLFIRLAESSNYLSLWWNYGKNAEKAVKKLSSENPQRPLLIVFDCNKDAHSFRNKFMDSLFSTKLPGNTRFVSLRSEFSDDSKIGFKNFNKQFNWRYAEYPGATLLHTAQTCETYLNVENDGKRYANLPSLDGIITLKERDLVSFESSIELVYNGCERGIENDVGIDMSGKGISFGEQFYKGDEASWNDIANHRDLPLWDERKHEKKLNKLLEIVENMSPRVKTIELSHEAGTGGTTLSKRILWDLKDKIPCARLKKYSQKTAEVILEICKRTGGKSVLLVVESGSTIATGEELNALKRDVDAQNGKLTILLVSRTEKKDFYDNEDSTNKKVPFIYLGNTMPVSVTERFVTTFSNYAAQRSNSDERIALLNKISSDDNYREQRSPFFYGFYAFQEEYNLISNLERTINECSPLEKELLNNLALVTIFSQNVCVVFSELCSILNIKSDNDSTNIYVLMDDLSPAISNLTVFHDNGLRICHKIIAEKILIIIHGQNYTQDLQSKNLQFEHVVFKAAKDYIESISKIYDCNDEYVDNTLKELIIDRAYIDAEEGKTRFSKLVESIPMWIDRKSLLELLIQKFPGNPHYYNHLARLLSRGDRGNGVLPKYDEAVKKAKKAIDVAAEFDLPLSSHQTTLGCIYGQWILRSIMDEMELKKMRRGAFKYPILIDSIGLHYSYAKEAFKNSRENKSILDSFSYFPQINMECEIVNRLLQFGREGRSLEKLHEQEPEFRQWYEEHFSIAVEMLKSMEKLENVNEKMVNELKAKIKSISMEFTNDVINAHLTKLLSSNERNSQRHRRSMIYSVFARKGCAWGNLEEKTLHLSEQCFRKNLEESDKSHSQADVETWFELYRKLKGFNASEAHAILATYMEDGYRKNYILSLMAFLMHEKGQASTETVIKFIKESSRDARSHGLNTAREYECYCEPSLAVVGCPIVSIKDVPRNEDEEPDGLKIFYGKVIEVEQTYGKILLEKMNLDVTFIPNPSSIDKSDVLRIFSRDDIGCTVSLSLMFSYSGLRGWNVVKK